MQRIEIHDEDVTMVVGTMMEIPEIKEAVEVVNTSTGIKTKVRPVSRVCPMPNVHAQLHHILHCVDTVRHGSIVNREVAKWLELQQTGGAVAGVDLTRFSRHDVPTSEVGLAGTQLSSSIYGTVVFDLTFLNEVTKSDNILKVLKRM
jgi:hypothetical protein